MRSILIQNYQWNVVSGALKRTEFNGYEFDEIDQKAFGSILLNVKSSLVIHIKNCKTTLECWKKEKNNFSIQDLIEKF